MHQNCVGSTRQTLPCGQGACSQTPDTLPVAHVPASVLWSPLGAWGSVLLVLT